MKITPRHEFLRDMDDRLFDRESIMPLILGLIVNLILCVVVVPTSAKVLLGDVATAGAEFSHDGMVKVDAPEPAPPGGQAVQVPKTSLMVKLLIQGIMQ